MMTAPDLSADAFDAFFYDVYGRKPFHWQSRLAAQACVGDWPRYIKLPTASGKTSCIDTAVFALAHQAWRRAADKTPLNTPRRIFFVVDRRIIVNEAYRRACTLRKRLTSAVMGEAHGSALCAVAYWLRSLTGNKNAPPLDCFELRGGIYRDDAWVRSLLQPTIVTSTVDQIGSRLLFRGYGVSDRNLPIHAALTANDSLILLDEAHCSKPFSQTVEAIGRYRDAALAADEAPRWAEQPLLSPFRFIEMTATPRSSSATGVLELASEDYVADPELEMRHSCAKPVRLLASKASGAKQNQLLAKDLVEKAVEIAKGAEATPPCQRVAIVVNRVECARKAYELLRNKHGDRVQLMIGRMRPLDRDKLTDQLQKIFRSDSDEELTDPYFVVATQCLEVGADFDFDGMVCQCASLDALRQRFGRLNRLGRSAHARGVIVMPAGDVKPKNPDPIYGESLPATWQWLQTHLDGDVVDVGVRAMDHLLASERSRDPDAIDALSAPAPDAPVLMPAHLDLLCQTAPRPALEPEIAAYLHGPQRGIPEVRVCWRADLPQPPVGPRRNDIEIELTRWAKTCAKVLSPCPPSSAECMSVPLPQLRHWLQGIEQKDESGDVLGEENENDGLDNGGGQRASNSAGTASRRCCVIWNANGCRAASGLQTRKQLYDSLAPNATVIIPASVGGWDFFGYVRDAPVDPASEKNDRITEDRTTGRPTDLSLIDVASEAFHQSRARHILRVHPALATTGVDRRALHPLLDFANDENATWRHDLLLGLEDAGHVPQDELLEDEAKAADGVHGHRAELVVSTRRQLHGESAKRVQLVRYPGGFALIGPRSNTTERNLPRASFDDEHDEQNLDADQRLSLADHLADVAAETERLVRDLNLSEPLQRALVAAAERHDLGKADPRFQAKLLAAPIDIAWMQPRLWAKSTQGAVPAKRASQNASEAVANGVLPSGFRHEFLSLEFAASLRDNLADDARDVMLHAIAAHHGHARPFAPVVVDNSPPPASLQRLAGERASGINLTIEADDRRGAVPAHRLDSGIAERFWDLNGRYGWWGLAWLEAIVRLADWTASATPNRRARAISLEALACDVCADREKCELPLPGLNAANPLGFLAALGLLRAASHAFPDSGVRMAWRRSGFWHPVLVTDKRTTEDELVDVLHNSLRGHQNEPQFTALGKNTTVPAEEFRAAALSAVGSADQRDRTFADFCAAFGTDALVSPNDGVTIQDTAIRTMAGAGHQHFLETMRNLIEKCEEEHLRKTIFRDWKYDDQTQTLSLRFDPLDDNRYALRWRNPSGDPLRKKSGSMIGANRLAIEAVPLLTTVPGAKRTQTVGFTGHRSSDTLFHWPIWTVPLSVSVVRSLLMLPDIVAPDFSPEGLAARGVAGIMCSQRITVGKVRNFTPAELKHSILGQPNT